MLGHDARIHEVQEVIRATGLGAAARQARAAEGLARDQRAGDAPVAIEAADAKLAAGPLQVPRATAEDAAGECEAGGVSPCWRLVAVGGGLYYLPLYMREQIRALVEKNG